MMYSREPRILIHFSNPYIFWSRVLPALPRIQEATGGRIDVVLSTTKDDSSLVDDLQTMLSQKVIESFQFCPDYSFPAQEKYGPVRRPFSELLFWLRMKGLKKEQPFDLVISHTLNSISGMFLLHLSAKMKIPIISLVPMMITRDSVIAGGFGNAASRVIPLFERLKYESASLLLRRAIAKLSGTVAFRLLQSVTAAANTGALRRPQHQFDSSRVLVYLCDTSQATQSLIEAGFSNDRVETVSFDREPGFPLSQRNRVLVVLGNEPSRDIETKYRDVLEDTLWNLADLHPATKIAIRPHPSSSAQSTSRMVVASISSRNSYFCLDEPTNTPAFRAIGSSKMVYGVMSSVLLEALDSGLVEVFGLRDLNDLIGYPRPEVPGISWLRNADLRNSSDQTSQMFTSLSISPPAGPTLSDRIASLALSGRGL